MPTHLLTYHAPGPLTADGEPRLVLQNPVDRPERLPLAERYRREIEDRSVLFDADQQRKLMDLVIDSQRRERHRCFGVAVDETRLLVLTAWTNRRTPADLRAGIRAALCRGMRREFGRGAWLGDGGGFRRVRNRTQFDYLLNTGLPKCGGLVWTVTQGFAPRLTATT